MQKSLYPTWYEFKNDLQKELGRSILNQEWLQLKPEKPLPWNDSCFQATLFKLLSPKKQFYKSYNRQLQQHLSHSHATPTKNGSLLTHA